MALSLIRLRGRTPCSPYDCYKILTNFNDILPSKNAHFLVRFSENVRAKHLFLNFLSLNLLMRDLAAVAFHFSSPFPRRLRTPRISPSNSLQASLKLGIGLRENRQFSIFAKISPSKETMSRTFAGRIRTSTRPFFLIFIFHKITIALFANKFSDLARVEYSFRSLI